MTEFFCSINYHSNCCSEEERLLVEKLASFRASKDSSVGSKGIVDYLVEIFEISYIYKYSYM